MLATVIGTQLLQRPFPKIYLLFIYLLYNIFWAFSIFFVLNCFDIMFSFDIM